MPRLRLKRNTNPSSGNCSVHWIATEARAQPWASVFHASHGEDRNRVTFHATSRGGLGFKKHRLIAQLTFSPH
jgi:hypothetical protein